MCAPQPVLQFNTTKRRIAAQNGRHAAFDGAIVALSLRMGSSCARALHRDSNSMLPDLQSGEIMKRLCIFLITAFVMSQNQ
jgi:hypothetical protein